MLHTSASEHAQVEALGKQLGLETLLAMAQILDHTLGRLRQSVHVRTLVEVALVRLCKLDDLEALPGLVAELRGQGTGDRGQLLRQPSLPPGPSAPNPEPSPASSPPQKKTPDVSDVPPPVAPEPVAPTTDLNDQSATTAWQQTLVEIGDMTQNFGERAERVAISGPNRLVVSFRKAYTQAQQYCERPEKRQKLEQTISRIAGRNLRIDFALLPDESAPAAPDRPAKPPVNRRQRQQELMRHPMIRKAAELFDTEIIAVLDAPTDEEP